jgi:hypothetical protein
MAPRQNLPLVLDLGDGRPVKAMTRLLDSVSLTFYVDSEMPVPSPGQTVVFEARIGGGGARGSARVVSVEHVDDGLGREMIAICEVSELTGEAAQQIARVGFRERVVEFAARNPEGEKILEASGRVEGGRRSRPNTTPLRPREAHWVPPALPRSEIREAEAAKAAEHDGGMREAGSKAPRPPGRKRPTRPGRHHWEVENRFKRGT